MGAFHRKASCTSPVSALLLFRIPYPIWTPCVKCMIGSCVTPTQTVGWKSSSHPCLCHFHESLQLVEVGGGGGLTICLDSKG